MTGSQPQQATADSGYFSEANVTDPKLEGIDLWVAPDQHKHGEKVPMTTAPPLPESSGVAKRMRYKLRRPEGQTIYKMRKALVEPVFGQIKEQRGFDKLPLRGLQRVEG